MKAIVCERPHQLDVEERPRPVRGAGEVLIRISRIGLCGTDYHIFAGNQPFLSYPRVMGHELAGRVAEADATSGFAEKKMLPRTPFGRCAAVSFICASYSDSGHSASPTRVAS